VKKQRRESDLSTANTLPRFGVFSGLRITDIQLNVASQPTDERLMPSVWPGWSRGTGTTAIRILIADEHELMRGALRRLIENHEGWEVCGEAEDGDGSRK
jgi:hypothetical protein